MRRDYSSNGARSMGILPMRTGRMPVPRIRCPRGSHTQFVLGTDCGFVIEGKAHGHASADRGYPLPGEARKKRVAQGSLSSLAVLPPRRGFGGAARDNSDYLVSGAARTPTAGKAAGPESGPCATRPDPDVRKAFRSRGTACRPLRVHCRRTRKGRASPTPTW